MRLTKLLEKSTLLHKLRPIGDNTRTLERKPNLRKCLEDQVVADECLLLVCLPDLLLHQQGRQHRPMFQQEHHQVSLRQLPLHSKVPNQAYLDKWLQQPLELLLDLLWDMFWVRITA